MRKAGHVARMGDRRCAYTVLVGKPEGKKDNLKKVGVNGRVILKCIFNYWNGVSN
jgi:hypothetical protein